MRTLTSLLLALGVSGVCASTAWSQNSDGLWRRFSNVLTKGRLDSEPTAARPQQVAVPRPSPDGSFETRGVVYIEEQNGLGTPPVVITTPKAPLVVPTNSPKAQPANVVAVPVITTPTPLPPAPGVARPANIAQQDPFTQNLIRQIGAKCPQARRIQITVLTPPEITIEIDVASMPDASAVADQVFAVRELDAFRITLKCNVPQREAQTRVCRKVSAGESRPSDQPGYSARLFQYSRNLR